MTEEKTASFKYERCIIDLTEFSHKVSVEVRVYDTEETHAESRLHRLGGILHRIQ